MATYRSPFMTPMNASRPIPNSGQGVWVGNTQIGSAPKEVRYSSNVLGAQSPTNNTQPSGNTGNSGDSGNNNNQPAGPSLDQQINDVFSPITSFLDQAQSNIQGQQGGIEGDIRSLADESRQSLSTEKNVSERQLDTQQESGEQRKEDALTAATRLFNELQRGGQQRFGGASSAGEAFQSLGNRELQRNRQNITQNYENFVQQVEGARQNLRDRYTTALAAIESEKNRRLNEARRAFQNRLQEIDRLRAESESAKANRKLQALQDLRNQVFQINLARAEQQGTVDQLAQRLDQELSGATAAFGQQVQTGADAGNLLASSTSVNPQTGLTIGGGQSNAAGQLAFNPTGIANQDEEEQVFGLSNPLQRNPREELFPALA